MAHSIVPFNIGEAGRKRSNLTGPRYNELKGVFMAFWIVVGLLSLPLVVLILWAVAPDDENDDDDEWNAEQSIYW